MISCIGCFWVLLSSALVAICSYSFATPAWIVKDPLRNEATVSFGLLWHCSESTDHMYSCYSFAGLGKFAEIPSVSWQASVVLCCGGCVLLAVSSMLAFITVFLPSGACERRACVLAGYVQMVSDRLVFTVTFPTLPQPHPLVSSHQKKNVPTLQNCFSNIYLGIL
ncbi:transmembrane protein 211-like isoform X2 [Anguilla anguilla]|uniref:transmembrane protein 211-like isoform X2 n=1 Tax=Anguilla anguilla TaxID=7936 RepID=UPI0015B0723C|nr:transmembrane protein 211-like isoform X2 [Anguilla anguilla]